MYACKGNERVFAVFPHFGKKKEHTTEHSGGEGEGEEEEEGEETEAEE